MLNTSAGTGTQVLSLIHRCDRAAPVSVEGGRPRRQPQRMRVAADRRHQVPLEERVVAFSLRRLRLRSARDTVDTVGLLPGIHLQICQNSCVGLCCEKCELFLCFGQHPQVRNLHVEA